MYPFTMRLTYHYVYKFRDVSVRQGLQDVNLTLEIVEELRRQYTPADRLDSDLFLRVLPATG